MSAPRSKWCKGKTDEKCLLGRNNRSQCVIKGVVILDISLVNLCVYSVWLFCDVDLVGGLVVGSRTIWRIYEMLPATHIRIHSASERQMLSLSLSIHHRHTIMHSYCQQIHNVK